jgi:hypothetical protein
VSVVLAEAVERAVTTALETVNGEIEQLLAAEVDRRLEQLALNLLAARVSDRVGELDLHRDVDEDDVHHAAKTCRVCGQAKPPEAYEKHRATCRQCRRERARAQAAEGDRPTNRPTRAG